MQMQSPSMAMRLKMANKKRLNRKAKLRWQVYYQCVFTKSRSHRSLMISRDGSGSIKCIAIAILWARIAGLAPLDLRCSIGG